MKKILSSQSGITLIELMITAIIIGLVASMAGPSFENAYSRMKFKKANGEIASAIKVARSMAITDKTPYGVVFDDASGTVTVFRDAVAGSYSYSSGSDSVISVDTLPNEFEYIGTDFTGNTLFFRPNGSADFEGGGYIHAVAYAEGVVGVFESNVLASTGRLHSEAYYY